MRLVAAVDRNWAIGKGGQLLAAIPQDQKRFRNMTLGGAVIMGRKTFDSLPGKQPLYGRRNVVLTKNPRWRPKGTVVCGSVEEALEAVKDVPPDQIYVMGGESIYRQFLPFCDEAEITWIDFSYEADTYLPSLDAREEWRLEEESEEQTCFDLCYVYRRYVRRASLGAASQQEKGRHGGEVCGGRRNEEGEK